MASTAINHDLLRTFVDAGTAPTFAAAAARRHITPSAVSQQIAALESQLGLRLFERFGRRVRLTEAGRALLAGLGDRLSEIDGVLAAVVDRRAEVAGTVCIGAPGPFARVWLRPRMVQLLQDHPALVIDARFAVTSALAQGLKTGDFDFCLLADRSDDPGIEARPIFVEHFVAVASDAYLDRRGRPRSASDFRTHQYLVFDDDLAMHAPWWRARFGRREPAPKSIVAKVASLDELLALAIAGIGIAVLPNYFVAAALASGAVTALTSDRPGARQPRNPIHLAWRKSAPRTGRFLAVQRVLLAPRPDDPV